MSDKDREAFNNAVLEWAAACQLSQPLDVCNALLDRAYQAASAEKDAEIARLTEELAAVTAIAEEPCCATAAEVERLKESHALVNDELEARDLEIARLQRVVDAGAEVAHQLREAMMHLTDEKVLIKGDVIWTEMDNSINNLHAAAEKEPK